jgi:hypothetical protein
MNVREPLQRVNSGSWWHLGEPAPVETAMETHYVRVDLLRGIGECEWAADEARRVAEPARRSVDAPAAERVDRRAPERPRVYD